DTVEAIAIERAMTLFGAEHANVQPHAGVQANMAVYMALLKPGDRVLGMDLAHGGHLTHGAPASFSGRFYDAYSYGLNPETERLDYDAIAVKARETRPKLVICGASAYPRIIDFARMGEIAREVGAYLMADIAHIGGLVAAGIHPSPVPHADVVTGTTHKTLRGPRGGLILCRSAFGSLIDKTIFPGMQGGPLMHIIAAKAVCFLEAMQPSFHAYQRQIVNNCRVLGEELQRRGLRLVTGGTDNHLILVDLTSTGVTGKEAQYALDGVGITANRNRIPFDTRTADVTSGIRFGTAAVTSRGFSELEMRQIARLIVRVIEHLHDSAVLEEVSEETRALCERFPVPGQGENGRVAAKDDFHRG
ncbi:MAG: serine hydroxymethyltransferase, partial [Chloroflexi bacterium]|nr:serine hydroxymethyltransferase [Chloroflexota bacterium]